jgi:hypothetical protein
MFSRRFALLAAILATLSLTLFVAPGLAIRKAIVAQLFGPRMVRAQVLEKSGVQMNLDRGVITQVNGTQLTLREFDGRIQSIPLSASTRVIHLGHQLSLSSLAPRWRVLVTWPATGAAQSVDVEKIPRTRGKSAGFLRKAIVIQLLGPKMVRAQVLEKSGLQMNLDRGVLTQVSDTQLTLREADGRVQPIPVDNTTKVIRLGHQFSLASLTLNSRVLVTWPATGPALSVDVEKIAKGHGMGASAG